MPLSYQKYNKTAKHTCAQSLRETTLLDNHDYSSVNHIRIFLSIIKVSNMADYKMRQIMNKCRLAVIVYQAKI